MKMLLTLLFFPAVSFAIGTLNDGYIVVHGTSERVNAHATCKKVENTHASRNYFIPTKTSPEWTSFVTNPPTNITLTNCDATYRSCQDILRANPSSTTGKYTIDPDGVSNGHPPIDVFCDMTTDGGGWTLVWSNTRSGTNKPTTNMNWVSATTTTPLCSEAQGAGTGCATYLSNSKEGFNYFIGLDWWNRITGHNKNSQMMYQWSSNYGSPIEQSSKFNFTRTNSSKLYSMYTNNYLQLVGSVIPGLYSYHFANHFAFSTIDVENDTHSSNCSSLYTNTPFWYQLCWNGSINGGGETSGNGVYNGAYYVSAHSQWGVPSGEGAGNGWLFVREYEYLANCTEIKSKNPSAPSGLYWIDPDGVGGTNPLFVQCDMTTDGGGWTLIFNQKSDTGGFFTNATEAQSYNITDPTADRYSILAHTEGFRSLKGNFTFKINWPGFVHRNIWQQLTNPIIDQPIKGYVPITIDSISEGWGGLERNCTIACTSSFMDGAVGNSQWWYSVGSYTDYVISGGHGIPASVTVKGSDSGVPQTQLWVRDDSFILKTPRDCQEILEYGQSIGNGLYWVDPTSSGSSTQVYCDMTSDGGGWTLVFNHNIAGGYFANAADVPSKNPATPTAHLYSILDRLDDFKANGRYIFKINWPGYNPRNIWAQTTNPTIDQPVAGYVPLAIDSSTNYWGGLERNCALGCTSSFMDGSVNRADWHYAIGGYLAYGSASPGLTSSQLVGGISEGVPQVQLWTRRSEGQFTKRSCKEILNAGLSTGDGFYYIDPDGVGGQVPFRVHCDMTTSGGGWTRVAYSNGTASPATVPNDFLINQYRKEYIGINAASNSASINSEWFSQVIGTTDAMLKAPIYTASPFIDIGLGIWEYNNTRCVGTLRHTSRTAGCAGQNANDTFNANDRFNIAVNNGNEGIVPYHLNGGAELCYSGKGNCAFEFYLR